MVTKFGVIKLSRGTRLLVHDNECVNVGGILCINPVRSNSILVLTNVPQHLNV